MMSILVCFVYMSLSASQVEETQVKSKQSYVFAYGAMGEKD